MSPALEKIFADIERLSGRPVLVQEDAALTTLAAIQYARHGAHAHVIRYKPQSGDPAYQIAVQAGFALRLFSIPEEKRMSFTLPNERRGETLRRLQVPGSLPSRVQDMLLDGLLLHLRSIPVGLRVDRWLSGAFPEFNAGQSDSIHRQLQENSGALAPEIRRSMPKKIVNATAAINGAFALHWSRLLGEPQQWLPYKALGYEPQAESLLKLLDTIPDDPGNDCDLVDQWALALALKGTYDWIPYHA